jgi:hypothetical protein
MPETITILGREVGLSGVMDPGGGAYGINSDIYHLKVNECSAQLYVNEGLGHPYNMAVMQRVLNNLGAQLQPEIKNLGDLIMQARPPEGYESKAELKEALNRIDPEIYPRVKDFLCVHTWSDPKVCNPVPLSEKAKGAYHPELLALRPYDKLHGGRIARYRKSLRFYGIEPDGASTTNLAETSIYGLDELNPCWIEITHRAPVNINTAPREVLVALLLELEGFYLMEQLRALPSRPGTHSGNWLYNLHEYRYTSPADYATGEIGVLLRSSPIDDQMAKEIAEQIIQYRKTIGPFRTWQQFDKFIDSLVEPDKVIWEREKQLSFFYIYKDEFVLKDGYLMVGHGGSTRCRLPYLQYAAQAIADTIKANFNPNLHLNELNPDAVLWQWVDKTDLIKNSTEFCFLPTGYFEIESVGQILRAEWEDGRFHISPYLLIVKDSFEHNNQVMGQRRLKVEVKLWDLYRDTTQSDFYQGTQFSPNSSQYATQYGLACHSMPEPDNGPAPLENSWEGYIQLATFGGSGTLKRKGEVVSTPAGEYGGEEANWESGLAQLHAHYEFDFKLHTSSEGKFEPLKVNKDDWTESGNLSPYCLAQDPKRYRICRGYRWSGKDLYYERTAPQDLRGDGFYAERHSSVRYRGPSSTGATLSFWAKPGFMPRLIGKARAFAYARLSCYLAWERWYDWLNLTMREPVAYTTPPYQAGVYPMVFNTRGKWIAIMLAHQMSFTDPLCWVLTN